MSRHGGVGCSELEAGMRVAQAFIGIADGESAQCPGVSSWVGSFNVPTWQTALAVLQAGKHFRGCTFWGLGGYHVGIF